MAPSTTPEGWRSFINANPSELALLPAGQWEALGEPDRRDYDEARIAHHAELVVITTSAIAEITSEGQILVLMNQREIGARRGLIVSGDAATGKTTSSINACESGHDHDREPADFVLPHQRQPVRLEYYSRQRTIAPAVPRNALALHRQPTERRLSASRHAQRAI